MPEEKAGLDDNQARDLIKAHLKAESPECRWCFAIDMQRVKGNIIGQNNFSDALLLHLSCPRCGGEFSHYAEIWEESYLRNIISKLHPDLGDNLTEESFREMNDRVFPEHLDV